jgi:hypothetical protein
VSGVWINILNVDLDVFISIRAALFVVEAQIMKELVLDDSMPDTSIGFQCHRLLATLLSYVGRTTVPVDNHNVITL